MRCGGRGAAGHGAHSPPVALAALLAVDGSFPGPRAHCAKHVQAQHTRDVARLPRVQHLNFPEFNVQRLRPYLRRPDRLCGDSDAGPPPPAAGPDGVLEHEVQELLKFKMPSLKCAMAGRKGRVASSRRRRGAPRCGRCKRHTGPGAPPPRGACAATTAPSSLWAGRWQWP